MSRLSDYLGRGIVVVSQMVITEETDITPDADMMTLVIAIGAGASGGAFRNSTANNARAHATGGNAGDTCLQLVRMLEGETYTLTPGVGGPSSDTGVGSGRSAINGTAGSDTTVSSTAAGFTTITAAGGNAGIAWAQDSGSGSDSTDHDWSDNSGSSGADLIFKGGYGGKITVTITQSINKERGLATGGGGVNLSGLPPELLAGGYIELTADANYAVAATGGGGTNGNGGNVVFSSTGSFGIATGGGSSIEPATDDTTATSNASTSAGIAKPYSASSLFELDGAGGDGKVSTGSDASNGNSGGDGAGGGARTFGSGQTSGPTGTLAGSGGIFGGGAAAATHSSRANANAGDAGFGGGGGGAVSNPTESLDDQAVSGAGGDGLVIVCILSDFGRVVA